MDRYRKERSGLPRNAREDDSKQWEKVTVALGLGARQFRIKTTK